MNEAILEDLNVNNKSGREGCWCKLRAELDLLKGEEDVAINESDNESD